MDIPSHGHTNGSAASNQMVRAGVPCQVVVTSLKESRYWNNQKPQSWDQRCEGIDLVVIEGGETIRLLSDAGQSPPQTGWILVLTSGDSERGFRWTLYGLPRGAAVPQED